MSQEQRAEKRYSASTKFSVLALIVLCYYLIDYSGYLCLLLIFAFAYYPFISLRKVKLATFINEDVKTFDFYETPKLTNQQISTLKHGILLDGEKPSEAFDFKFKEYIVICRSFTLSQHFPIKNEELERWDV